MPVTYLKKAAKTAAGDAGDVRATVQAILDDIEARGDVAAREYAEKLDKYAGNLVLTRAEIDAAAAKVSPQVKDDIRYAHDNVRRFAEAQKSTITDVQARCAPASSPARRRFPARPRAATRPGGAI